MAPTLYGPNGDPITMTAPLSKRKAVTVTSWMTYLDALYRIGDTPWQRAQTPFANHIWVYAAAMIRAVNMAQAPLLVFRETDASAAGRTPRAGTRRRAVERHLTRQANPDRFFGRAFKNLEPALDHPLYDLLKSPSHVLTQATLMQITSLFLSVRGEAFWLGLMEDGRPPQPGEQPDELWPVPPTLLEAVMDNGRHIGWAFNVPKNIPTAAAEGAKIPIRLHEIVQFKYPNPINPIRGLSPLAACSMQIFQDLTADAHNTAVMNNGADPGGILTYEGEMSDEEEEAFLKKWNERHSGPQNARNADILRGSWKYMQTALTPQDMEYQEQKRWNREAIFASMRVPKATLGITEDLNYATQVGQDFNLWDKSLLPDVRLVEDTIDMSLMFGETDNFVVAFDLTGVEALRAGQADKIENALSLMDQKPHMPPDVAFNLVGIPVPEYVGSDTALVPLNIAPVKDVIELGIAPEPAPEPEPEPEEPEEGEPEEEDAPIAQGKPPRGRRRNALLWANFIRVQSREEAIARRAWRQFVRDERSRALALFDEVTGFKQLASPGAVLLPLGESISRLQAKMRGPHESALQSTLTLMDGELGGIAVYELDDPRFATVFAKRAEKLVGPPTVINSRLQESLGEGLLQGETLAQLRSRVSGVYNNELSAGRSLTVARTESSGFMSHARQVIFEEEGYKELVWVDAGDEAVRDTHVFFGSLGPRPANHDYLSEPGYDGDGEGTLRFPGDPDASGDETINCRCVMVTP